MTKFNRKKKTPLLNLDNSDSESAKNIGSSIPLATSKALPTSKHTAFKHKPPTVTAAPQAKVGLLVTAELEKAIEECKTKVAQIVKGCRRANRRFRDEEFDLENDKIRCLKGLNSSDEYAPSPPAPPAVLRVTEIFDNPQFFIDGADAIDIIQGKLGDCWLLSALSTMSTSKGLIEKLCVERDEEVGVYGFVFFRGSTWVSVIIDDQLFWSLPKYEELSSREQELYRGDREMYNTLSRHGGKGLHFARSGTEGETWVPLIEKAYAKLHGNYESLVGGLPSEAVEDLTGGVSVMYLTKDILDKDRFWKEELLHATHDRLFGCSFNGLDTSRMQEVVVDPRVNGLIGGHAYSVLRVKECKGKRFVVCRNPWGESEWTGAWADGSKEWTGEWLEVLKELNHVFGDDGEFVMEYSDFLDTFEVIERTTIFDSSWVMSSHWLRLPPQRPNHLWTFGDLSFKFTLSKPSFTIISLSQLDTRYFQEISGNFKWNIDFAIYKRGETQITGVSYYAFFTVRSVTCELDLEAGEYIIFPRCDRHSCYEVRRTDWDSRTLSRIRTEKARARSIAVNLNEADSDIHFPTTIDTLIEQDLKKLTLDSEKKKVDDDDNDDGDEETEEAEEEGEEGEEDEEKEEKEEDELEKAEGDSEKGGTEELPVVIPYIPPSPGSPYGYGMFPKPQDSNDDDLVLGVRIYTQGGAVVSVTGQVVNEEIIEEDEDDNAAKGKEDGEKEDKDDKKEDKDDKKEDKDDKKEAKKAKKAKEKKKKKNIPVTQSSKVFL